MNSFYGGHPGTPFVIAATFETVDDMVSAFQKGPSYTQVRYGEYVLISPTQENTLSTASVNADRGNVYRRGYDYSNSMGGAEYIGNIAGPMGPSSVISFKSYEEFISQYPTADSVNLSYITSVEQNESGRENIKLYYANIPNTNQLEVAIQIPKRNPTITLELSDEPQASIGNLEAKMDSNGNYTIENIPFCRGLKNIIIGDEDGVVINTEAKTDKTIAYLWFCFSSPLPENANTNLASKGSNVYKLEGNTLVEVTGELPKVNNYANYGYWYRSPVAIGSVTVQIATRISSTASEYTNFKSKADANSISLNVRGVVS